MARQITLNDIARQTSLSVTAVWRSLADDPQITDSTKQRVRDVSKRLNYRPRAYARSRPRQRAGAPPALRRIGLVMVDARSGAEQITSLAAICQEVDTRAKLEITIIHSSDEPAEQQRRLSEAAGDVDGILLDGSVPVELFRFAAGLKTPVVLMGQPLADPDLSIDVGYQLAFDCQAMARLATRSLWQAGHRRIAYMCEAMQPNLWTERWFAGYREAMSSLAGAVDPAMVQVPGHVLRPPAVAAQHFAKLREKPTALVLPDPSLAAHMISELKALGVTFEHDAIVIGATMRTAQRYRMENRPLILVDPDAYVLACLRTLRSLVAGQAPPPGRYLLPFTHQNLPAPVDQFFAAGS